MFQLCHKPHEFLFWLFKLFLHLLQSEDIEDESHGEEDEEVDPDLLEWGEAGKIFGLLEGKDEIDEEECRKVVNGIKVFREGITKQMEGLKLKDEGLAIVREAVAKHPLRALGPLLDAAMMGSRGGQPHPTASIGKHVKQKCPAPSPISTHLSPLPLAHPLLPILLLYPLLSLPHQVHKTSQAANGKPPGLMLMVCTNINAVDVVWFIQQEMQS